MNTSQTFSNMINEYLPNALMWTELKDKGWVWKNVESDDNWKGGTLIEPFVGAEASSISLGSLTASDDVSEYETVRGEITIQPECWGTLKFNHKDIMKNGKVSEQSLLKMLPNMVDKFIENMKFKLALQHLNGPSFAKATGNGDVLGTGIIVVDRPERFTIGEKVYLEDDNTPAVTDSTGRYYVKAVNINTKAVTLAATRGGGASSLSAYTSAQNAKFYYDGGQTAANRFTSLKSSLLSAANGGSSSLYGVSKVAYPFTQGINVDGSSANAANLLDLIFDGIYTTEIYGKGSVQKVLCSYRIQNLVKKLLESQKGSYHINQTSDKVQSYGWRSISILGGDREVELVALREMDNDYMVLLDPSAVKIYTDGGFQKRENPDDGRSFYEVRATTGFYYLVDVAYMGDLVLEKPSTCGIIHSLPDISSL